MRALLSLADRWTFARALHPEGKDQIHGWSTHVRAGATYAGGFVAVFLGTAKAPIGIPVGTIGGNLCLDPASTLVPFPLVPLDASGNADIKIVDPVGTYGPTTVYLQGVAVTSALALHFTNLNATTLQ